jgi:hypothetical protein
MKECPCGGVCRNYRARPPVPAGETVKTIPLGGGLYAYVDAEDYEWLNQWHWRAHGGYAARNERSKRIFMHRQIMQPPKGKVVDHISGNGYDNTRANLRNITGQQNMLNKEKRVGAISMYKGVGYDRRRHQWYARVYSTQESSWLGLFDTEVEAARAYDYGAIEMFGEYGRLNFPEEWPAARRKKVHAKWQREQAKQKGKSGGERGNARARSKTPARDGRKRATRDSKRVTKRAPRKTPSRIGSVPNR